MVLIEIKGAVEAELQRQAPAALQLQKVNQAI